LLDAIDGPANLHELDEFRIWLVKKFEQLERQQAKAADPSQKKKDARAAKKRTVLHAMWEEMDANQSGLLSFGEFRRYLTQRKYPKLNMMHPLFMCLDLKNNGVIEEGEFMMLNILSSTYQLLRVTRIRDFMKEKFGTLKAAFKAMDDNNSGMLSLKEWLEVMQDQYNYPEPEDVNSTFKFLDKDGSMILNSKEFDFLAAFEPDEFLRELKAFAEHLVQKSGGIDEAYDTFDPNSHGLHGIDHREFLSGYRRCGFKGTFDPLLIFNFIDASHSCRISKAEFRLLLKLDAQQVFDASSVSMRAAISSFKTFARREVEIADDAQMTWEEFHEDLLKIVEDENL